MITALKPHALTKCISTLGKHGAKTGGEAELVSFLPFSQ